MLTILSFGVKVWSHISLYSFVMNRMGPPGNGERPLGDDRTQLEVPRTTTAREAVGYQYLLQDLEQTHRYRAEILNYDLIQGADAVEGTFYPEISSREDFENLLLGKLSEIKDQVLAMIISQRVGRIEVYVKTEWLKGVSGIADEETVRIAFVMEARIKELEYNGLTARARGVINRRRADELRAKRVEEENRDAALPKAQRWLLGKATEEPFHGIYGVNDRSGVAAKYIVDVGVITHGDFLAICKGEANAATDPFVAAAINAGVYIKALIPTRNSDRKSSEKELVWMIPKAAVPKQEPKPEIKAERAPTGGRLKAVVDEIRWTLKAALIPAAVVVCAFLVVDIARVIREKAAGQVEQTEVVPAVNKKPFAVLLEQGRREFNATDFTKSDRMLKMDRVIDNLLAGKFKYLATEIGLYPSTVEGKAVQGSRQEEIYRFTLIGKLSGHTTANKDSQNAYQTTTLADAVNTLLEPNLTDEQLKTWICWLYETSFSTKLERNRLQIVRGANRAFDKAAYNAPAGFETKKLFLGIHKMDESEGSEPGGRDSRISVEENLLGEGNRLLLPSGLSPYHDVRVPGSLLKSDPEVKLKLGKKGDWNLRASEFSSRISDLEQRMAANVNNKVTFEKVFGYRTVTTSKIAPLIDINDPTVKLLVDWVIKDIDKNDHPKKIQAIIDFIQELPYKWEYASNFDRPGLLVLFNEGGDCNNVTDLYVQMMAAAGYDSAVMHVALKDVRTMLHARGGVPAKYFPNADGRAWNLGDKEEWRSVELTGKYAVGVENWGDKETTYHIEVVRAPKPVEEAKKTKKAPAKKGKAK